MNKAITKIVSIVITASLCLSCNSEQQEKSNNVKSYKPIDIALQHKIEELDSIFFTAYNNCDLDKQASLIAEDIEFYHDKGGLMTSKIDIIEATKNNICGKVTRELIKGSIEVYPINNYGAVQIGYHKFFNNQEPDAISNPSKFIAIWKNENKTWQMSRIVSLH
ncbi:MAG: nuclear transport factor 2 family protein [Flavobacteriaceae bacterium]